MTAIPTIESERLILRPWREADIDGYAAIYVDAERSQFIGGPLSREDAWRKMATVIGHWSLRGYGTWALEEKASRRFVGYCGPWNPMGWPEPEIGWGLLADVEGSGFATEAALRARAYAYEALGWSTAISVIRTDNTPSIRVAERLGCTRESTAEYKGQARFIYRHPPSSKLQASSKTQAGA